MKTDLLRIDEVAARLGVSVRTIYRNLSRGDFPEPVRVSPRRAVWPADDLEAWLTRRTERNTTRGDRRGRR